jgi:hypothetical protein
MTGHHSELPEAFLSKPYEFETLSEAIYRVLAWMTTTKCLFGAAT